MTPDPNPTNLNGPVNPVMDPYEFLPKYRAIIMLLRILTPPEASPHVMTAMKPIVVESRRIAIRNSDVANTVVVKATNPKVLGENLSDR